MEPIHAGAPRGAWRTAPVVDLTQDNFIQPPTDFPTFSAPDRPKGFTSVNRAPGMVFDNRPPAYSLPAGGAVPGMTHYGGEFLDTAKTTESLKELLEGINDEPVPKRTRKKKKNKLPKKEEEEEELASMMANAELIEKDKAAAAAANLGGIEQKVKEEPAEEEEEEEEEDLSRVDGLNVPLLPHQVRGLAFLLSREEKKAKGGILADDVGSFTDISVRGQANLYCRWDWGKLYNLSP